MTFLHGIPIFEINGMINRTAVIRRVGVQYAVKLLQHSIPNTRWIVQS